MKQILCLNMTSPSPIETSTTFYASPTVEKINTIQALSDQSRKNL